MHAVDQLYLISLSKCNINLFVEFNVMSPYAVVTVASYTQLYSEGYFSVLLTDLTF